MSCKIQQLCRIFGLSLLSLFVINCASTKSSTPKHAVSFEGPDDPDYLELESEFKLRGLYSCLAGSPQVEVTYPAVKYIRIRHPKADPNYFIFRGFSKFTYKTNEGAPVSTLSIADLRIRKNSYEKGHRDYTAVQFMAIVSPKFREKVMPKKEPNSTGGGLFELIAPEAAEKVNQGVTQAADKFKQNNPNLTKASKKLAEVLGPEPEPEPKGYRVAFHYAKHFEVKPGPRHKYTEHETGVGISFASRSANNQSESNSE